jgi:drug/metabolite transporter (DMT)-like permease
LNRFGPLAMGIAANVIGGSSYLVQKTALTEFPPSTVAALRIAIALPLMWLVAPKGWTRTATKLDWWRMVLIGTLGLAAPHLVGNYGLKDTASLNGAILIGMEPIAIVLLSVLFLRERIRAIQLAGIAAAFVGATSIVSNGDLASIGSNPASRGNLLLALSGVLWAIFTVAGKPTLERVPAAGVTIATSAIALLVLGAVAILERPSIDLGAYTFLPIAAVIVLGVVVSFAGTLLWNVSLKSLTATQVGVLVFLQPMVGSILGVLVGEPLPPALLIGAPLIFVGIYLAELKPDRR